MPLASIFQLPAVASRTRKLISLLRLPIAGSVAAGVPEENETAPVEFSEIRLPQSARTFNLRVQGTSMIGAGILPGDIAIFEHRGAQPNEIVAALIDGRTTLKRLVYREGKPFLKAENPRFPGLAPAYELVIQGVLVGLVRLAIRKA